MNWMDRLNRRFRFGIPNLMIYITATMLVVYVLGYGLRLNIYGLISFNRDLILNGQIWRLITFIFQPPSSSPIFVILSLYFYYFIGNTLENVWGSNRFTLYYLFGIVGAVIAGFIAGGTTNTYLNLSLFFAFAQLFPDHQVLLFFVIPIKIKYLAYVNWFFFLVNFLFGGMVTRVAILFSLLNFFLFFGPDIFSGIRRRWNSHQRRKEFERDMRNNRNRWH